MTMSLGGLRAVDDDSFGTEVEERSSAVLVDFWAPWCGPCKALAPTLLAVAEERSGDLEVVAVDIAANGQVAGKYQVMALPTLILFRDGGPVATLVRPTTKADIDRFLDES